MSRIGKLPVKIPSGVTVEFSDGKFSAKGPKGEITQTMPPLVSVENNDGQLQVKRDNDGREARAMHGLAGLWYSIR